MSVSITFTQHWTDTDGMIGAAGTSYVPGTVVANVADDSAFQLIYAFIAHRTAPGGGGGTPTGQAKVFAPSTSPPDPSACAVNDLWWDLTIETLRRWDGANFVPAPAAAGWAYVANRMAAIEATTAALAATVAAMNAGNGGVAIDLATLVRHPIRIERS